MGSHHRSRAKELDQCVFAQDKTQLEFFVYVAPGMVEKWRKDKTIPLVDVVESYTIYRGDTDGHQGIYLQPSQQDLANTFQTVDESQIIKTILEKGTVIPFHPHNTKHDAGIKF